MADKLTPQQALAVHHRGGKLLVSAAAGSGKTKVLVDRLMKYLSDPRDPADLDEFLIITYTKAAASELRGKIASKLSERIALEPENKHLQKQMQRLFLTKISTVHGFCADLLREYAYRLELSADFRVADENECREIRETVLAELLDRAYGSAGEDTMFRAFVDNQGLGRDDRLVPEIILKVYDSAKCHLNPQGWLDKCLEDSTLEDVLDASQTVWGSFLMEDLREYVNCQIRVMEQCAKAAQEFPGFEKVAANLRNTVYQLKTLAESKTWDDVIDNKNIDYGRVTFPRKYKDPELEERIKAARNACKKGIQKKLSSFADPSELVLEDLRQSAQSAEGLVALVRQFERDYTQAKQSRRVLDFSDLEHRALDLLLGKARGGPTAAASEIGQRFREIMVDEYQDSNAVQDAIFYALTARKQNCFMVGDVKQSIYQFRLADPGIFLQKYWSYLPAEDAQPGDGVKVLLSHNFRSGPEVIEAVNDVFETSMTPEVGGLSYGEEEALREGVPHERLPDRAVELHALEVRESAYQEEAAFVADRICQMLQSGTPVRQGDMFRPVTPEDIVILLRSPGSVGAYFQKALENRGIRCVSGGSMDLLRTQEIATFRSLLQTIYNPRQDIPLVSTLASPVFAFTADDLAAFRAGHRGGYVYDALRESDRPKAREFIKILEQLRRVARMNTLSQLLEACLVLTRIDCVYAAMEDGQARQENLQTFFRLAADFEAGNQRDLGQFLDHLDAMEDKGLMSAGSASGGAVTIMSIHKSKGLEFPVVFLCGLAREFNRESTRAQILCDKELGLGLSVADHSSRVRYPTISKRAIGVKMTRESLSEEMRVLYVAMTRARDRLVMTYAPRNLQSDLQDIALRQDFDQGELLRRDVVCPGEWVMQTAMNRMEAGALFALGGRPGTVTVKEIPWHITVSQGQQTAEAAAAQEEAAFALTGKLRQRLEDALRFRYPHNAATVTPSKQTATQRKGRQKDAEAAENAREPKNIHRSWRKPSFLEVQSDGREYGNAIHAAMQYIQYDACENEDGVRQEIHRLVDRGFLSGTQGEMVDHRAIAAFFQTPLGQKLKNGTPCIREFKFSILDDAAQYGEGLQGEQVLLQGVVDCAMLEEDGITVIDFKTDYVTELTLSGAVERYRPQVLTYGDALSRIYEKHIKGQYLYFFRLNRFVQL